MKQDYIRYLYRKVRKYNDLPKLTVEMSTQLQDELQRQLLLGDGSHGTLGRVINSQIVLKLDL